MVLLYRPATELYVVVVVVVVFTLTDRAQPYPVIYVVANPVRGHKEVPRSTGHIMVTTRYSDQQGSKSRQKVMRLYKRWHRPIAKRFIKLPLLHIESSLDRLGLLSPTHDQRSQQQIGQTRSNQFYTTVAYSFARRLTSAAHSFGPTRTFICCARPVTHHLK